jgi:hypothetical protein
MKIAVDDEAVKPPAIFRGDRDFDNISRRILASSHREGAATLTRLLVSHGIGDPFGGCLKFILKRYPYLL